MRGHRRAARLRTQESRGGEADRPPRSGSRTSPSSAGDAFDPGPPDRLAAAAGHRGRVGPLRAVSGQHAESSALSSGWPQVMPEGGSLIYTNQPWHPQLELIARGLTDWDGKPWVMRRRTQAEMDDLVRAAGFEKNANGDRSMGHVHGVARAPRVLSAGDVARAVGPLRRRLRGNGLAHVACAATWGRGPSTGNGASRWSRWLIVPYMSLDLFFVAAPFLCADARGAAGVRAGA